MDIDNYRERMPWEQLDAWDGRMGRLVEVNNSIEFSNGI